MKKSQKGFAVLEGLLILIIIAAICSIGWHVIHAKQQADNNLDNASAINTTATAKKAAKPVSSPAAETANWLSYAAPDKSYKIKIADGWKLTKQTDSSVSLVGFTNADITYVKGTKAQVVIEPGGRDGPVPFTLYEQGKEGVTQYSPQGAKVASLKTGQGLQVDKYVYTQDAPQEGPGLPQGSKGYTYVVAKGGTMVYISHDESPGDPNNVDIIEQVVKTIEL